MAKRYFTSIGALQFKPAPAPRNRLKQALAFQNRLRSTATGEPKLNNVDSEERWAITEKGPDGFGQVANILALDARKDRAFLYSIDPEGQFGHTTVKFQNVKRKYGDLRKAKRSIIFDFGNMRRKADIVLQAASTLARLLERWPHSLDFGPKERRILADIALELSSAPLSKSYPEIDGGPPESYYSSRVDGIGPDTGILYTIRFRICPENITNIFVPGIPETERIDVKQLKALKTRFVKTSNGDRLNERSKHRAAIRVLQLALWKYHHKILRSSDVKNAIGEMISKYAAKTQDDWFISP